MVREREKEEAIYITQVVEMEGDYTWFISIDIVAALSAHTPTGPRWGRFWQLG